MEKECCKKDIGGSGINHESPEPQALLVTADHFRLLRVFTYFSIFCLVLVVFVMMGGLCMSLPVITDLTEGMNLTLPPPTKAIISLLRMYRPFFEFRVLNVVFFSFAALFLIYGSMQAAKYIFRKAMKDFLMVFLLEMTSLVGFTIFFLLIVISIFVILCIPIFQIDGCLH